MISNIRIFQKIIITLQQKEKLLRIPTYTRFGNLQIFQIFLSNKFLFM